MSQTSGQVPREVGARLRKVRQALGLSLADVEGKSGGRWKGVVVGSYERADRALTVARLYDLAGFYGVSPRELLPPADGDTPMSAADVARYARMVADWFAAQAAGELAQPRDDESQ